MDPREKAKTSWERWDDAELERELAPWPETLAVTLTEADVQLMRRLARMVRDFHDEAHGRDCTCQYQILKEAADRLGDLSSAWVKALELGDETEPAAALLSWLAQQTQPRSMLMAARDLGMKTDDLRLLAAAEAEQGRIIVVSGTLRITDAGRTFMPSRRLCGRDRQEW
jgi:hypothetical protein